MIQDPNSVFWSEELLVSVGYTHGTGARAMIQKELYIETTSPLSFGSRVTTNQTTRLSILGKAKA